MTRLLHVTTSDMSLELLLGPQLRAFRDAGYEVHTASAPGPYVERLVADGHRATTRCATPRGRRRPIATLAALAELYRLFRRLQPRHRPHPQPQARRVRPPGGACSPGCRSSSTPSTGSTRSPTDRWRRGRPVYLLERVAAACSDVELVQNPEDIETLAAARRTARASSGSWATASTSTGSSPDRSVRSRGRERSWATTTTTSSWARSAASCTRRGTAELFEAARLLRTAASRAALVSSSGPPMPRRATL